MARWFVSSCHAWIFPCWPAHGSASMGTYDDMRLPILKNPKNMGGLPHSAHWSETPPCLPTDSRLMPGLPAPLPTTPYLCTNLPSPTHPNQPYRPYRPPYPPTYYPPPSNIYSIILDSPSCLHSTPRVPHISHVLNFKDKVPVAKPTL